MAKDQKPVEELSGIAEQTMEQARGAVDVYFDCRREGYFIYPLWWTVGEKLRVTPRRMSPRLMTL